MARALEPTQELAGLLGHQYLIVTFWNTAWQAVGIQQVFVERIPF